MINLTGQLEVDVEEASIPSTRKKIERGLSDIEIGGGSGLSGQLSRDVNGAAGASNRAGNTIQAEQLSVLQDIKDVLEKSAVSGGDGGSASDTVLDLALAKRVAGGGGAAASGSVLSRALSTVGSASLASLSVGGAAIGLPALAYYGISRENSANYDVTRRQRQRRQDGDVAIATPQRSATEDLEQQVSNIQVEAPPWLEDPTLQTPEWLNGPISVDVPDVLRDLPTIGISIPPALEGLLDSGGDSYSNPSRINPNQPREGGDVALQTYADNQTSNRSRDRFDINLNVEHQLRNASREFEQAIDDAIKRSSALERLVQEELRKAFENHR